MLKYALFTSLAFLLFFSGILFTDEGPSVSAIFPRELKPGVEAQVEITLKKGTIQGFGSLTIELPEGISVVKHEDMGATYIFGDKKAVWEWVELPTTDVITIRCTIVADISVKGTKAISGFFLFTENNEKKNVNMDNVELEVLAPVSEPMANDSTQKKSASPDITFIRSYERSATQLTVNLVIKKGYTKGFGRYSDEVPENVMVKALVTDGSSFSVADKRLKFVWVNVPDKPELIISYVMICTATPTVKLDGEYAYLDRNQTHKYKLPAEVVKIGNIDTTTPALEIATNFTPQTNNAMAQGTIQAETITKEEPIKAPQKTKSAETDSIKPLSIKEPSAGSQYEPEKANQLKQTNAYFCVQVGAFMNPNVNSNQLKSRFNLSGEIRSEMHDGMYKFVTGKFQVYKEARDKREQLKSSNGVNGAFVAAYNAGKRITVQEALMISSQKWFK